MNLPLRAPGLAAFLLLLSACGSDEEPPPSQPTVTATAGGEAVAPRRPTGPALSYVGADHTVVMRLDMTRVRASSLSDDIGSLVRAYPTWDQLLGRSGIDPIQNFDLVLVSAPTGVTGRSVMLLRHNLTEAQVRDAVLNMSAQRGERTTWRDMNGFAVVDWPADTDPPRTVVISGEGELVVCVAEDLDRVIAVATDHRARRDAPTDIVEPQLSLEERTVATVAATELSERWTSRIPHPPQAFELVVRQDEQNADRLHIFAQGSYADPATAERARAWLEQQRDQYAGQLMVRAMGLDRLLRETQIRAEGTTLEVETSLTEQEIERVLGLVALAGMAGG